MKKIIWNVIERIFVQENYDLYKRFCEKQLSVESEIDQIAESMGTHTVSSGVKTAPGKEWYVHFEEMTRDDFCIKYRIVLYVSKLVPIFSIEYDFEIVNKDPDRVGITLDGYDGMAICKKQEMFHQRVRKYLKKQGYEEISQKELWEEIVGIGWFNNLLVDPNPRSVRGLLIFGTYEWEMSERRILYRETRKRIQNVFKKTYNMDNYDAYKEICKQPPININHSFFEILERESEYIEKEENMLIPGSIWKIHFLPFTEKLFHVEYTTILYISKIMPACYISHEFKVINQDKEGLMPVLSDFFGEGFCKKQVKLEYDILDYLKKQGYENIEGSILSDIAYKKENGKTYTVKQLLFSHEWKNEQEFTD
ncbi:MAG: hypothetical protein LKF40_02295 [Megasphaera sp.]|jgi:hypothetical protein|nr:hypothetical protein [Megasphaera sp.]